MHRVLKPGGRFVFLTPNRWDYASLAALAIPNRLHPMLVRRLTDRKECDTFPTFYRANSNRAIRRLARQSGFEVESIRYLNQYPDYFRKIPPLFLLGVAYERLTSAWDRLGFLRGWILGTLVRDGLNSRVEDFLQKHPNLGNLSLLAGDRHTDRKALIVHSGRRNGPGLLIPRFRIHRRWNISMSLAKPQQPGATAMNTLPASQDQTGGRDLAAEVRAFVLKSFPLARKQQIKNSDALLESGMIDSQGVLEVVEFIEREFSTILEDEELSPENFQTIDRIAAFIRSKADGHKPGSGVR